jgi:hypothetical protein
MAPGSYTLTCDGSQRFMVAVGGGTGAWLVVAIAGALFPGTAGILVVLITTIKRRRWRKRQEQDE